MPKLTISKRIQFAICFALFTIGNPFIRTSSAEVKLPALFTEHMVLQQKQVNPVWGWAAPGEEVAVSMCGQTKKATADAQGNWRVKLDPLKVGGPYKLSFQGKSNTIEFKDVLVGEVWICSGQSNMSMSVSRSNDPQLEILAAKYPKIRLITVPRVGTQKPQNDFEGKWEQCTPETVPHFSAVAYYFGRQLHQTMGVPVGLIHDSWGGSSCEAWIKRDLLEKDEKYKSLMDRWKNNEKNFDFEKVKANHLVKLKKWQAAVSKAKEDGKKPPRRPRNPRNILTGQHRPANLYNGMLKPVIGYGIKGAIWYQGESNSGRAHQYRTLFPLMIQSWRDEWGQGDFPFYWVQLADFKDEVSTPGNSMWAELREAQTLTMKTLKNTGEAVILNTGEADDIHPRDKQSVGKRLARWALAKQYGVNIKCQSPLYKSSETKGNKITITFDHAENGLNPFDVRTVKGFTIAGEDQKFVWAKAKVINKNQVIVWSDEIKEPKSVRYGWADNPVCNLESKVSKLPVTPFRTDDWKMITQGH